MPLHYIDFINNNDHKLRNENWNVMKSVMCCCCVQIMSRNGLSQCNILLLLLWLSTLLFKKNTRTNSLLFVWFNVDFMKNWCSFCFFIEPFDYDRIKKFISLIRLLCPHFSTKNHVSYFACFCICSLCVVIDVNQSDPNN